MNILVTGATGFIGSWFVDKISENNIVYCIVREESTKYHKLPKHRNLIVIKSNIKEISTIKCLIDIQIDAVYHFAWGGIRGTDRQNDYIQWRSYFDSLFIVDFVIKRVVPKLIILGSQEEFGDMGNIDESTITNPRTKYGYYKNLLHVNSRYLSCKFNFKLYWLRVFSVFGNGDYKNSLITEAIHKLSINENIDLRNVNREWDYLYIKDLVSALEQLIIINVKPGAYNLAYGESFKLRQYLDIIKDSIKSEGYIISRNEISNQNLKVSVEETKYELDWAPKFDFKSAIADMLCINNKKEMLNQQTDG